LDFQFLINTQSKIFLDFCIANHKGKVKQTKEANEEKQQKYFWSFCVLESRNKTRTTKERKLT